MDRPAGLLYFFPYSRLSSYLLLLFLCLISFLLFQCASVCENTCAWGPPFPIAIPNGTFLFRETRWSESSLAKTNYNDDHYFTIAIRLTMFTLLPHTYLRFHASCLNAWLATAQASCGRASRTAAACSCCLLFCHHCWCSHCTFVFVTIGKFTLVGNV